MSDKDETKTQDTNVDASTDRADDAEGQDQLGDAGKKALDAMKAKWQTERDARKERDAELAAAKAELAKAQAGKGDEKKDDKADTDQIRKQAKEEAKAEARAEVLKDRALDKVEAKAAKLFADPEDARALLAGKVDSFVDNGKIDIDAINDALEELLKKKPHLAAQGGKRFEGSADQGSRKGGTRPAQLTKADLDRMSPEAIVEAKKKGQFDDLLGIKR